MVDTTHFNDKFGDAGSYCFTNIIGVSHCQHIGIIVILGMIESPYIYTYTRIYIYIWQHWGEFMIGFTTLSPKVIWRQG